MSANPTPPETHDRRRPRYVVFALVVAMLFGAGCWVDGCARLSFYRGDVDQTVALHAGIQNEETRAQVEARYQTLVAVMEGARTRAVPLAAATFVLGAALLTLAGRGLRGRLNTRSHLIQVVIAQALVVGASYFSMRDVRNAELDWELARQRSALAPDQVAQLAPIMDRMKVWVPPAWLTLRTALSVFVVIALSRARSREFFEAAGRELPDA